MSDNGTFEASNQEVRLSPGALRRLARLHARTEGAQLIERAATQTVQQMQLALREALTEACEEEGVFVPEGSTATVDIDWRTGVVKLSPPEDAPPALARPAASPQF